MINQELASIFEDLADMEEIEGNRWESIAYRKAALSISTLSEDIKEIYKRGELQDVDGVGKSIAAKIIQYIETGKIAKYEEMKKKYPIDFTTLRKIHGLGAKRIVALHKALGIQDLNDLKRAIDENQVSKIPGFGEKSQEAIEKAILTYMRTGSSRLLLGYYYDQFHSILDKLLESGLFVQADIAGSVRRMKDTIGDLDILAVSDSPDKAVDYFFSLEEVKESLARGETKVSALLSLGVNCDLRIIAKESYGAALQYFTGSKEHNIRMREIAIEKGMKLNEYGLFKGDNKIAGDTEEGVYSALGLKWIPPELRENMGEIDASYGNGLPNLVEQSEVLGELHAHTNASDGRSTLLEMAAKAKDHGYKYMALTDHSVSLKISNGLDVKRFTEQHKEIDEFNEKNPSMTILKGVELEILKDGSFDLPDKLLKDMDFVVGGLHQSISEDISANTARLIKAIESGLMDTVAHPTGRLIGTREPYRLNFDKIFQAAEDNNVAIEINGFPERSDLPYDLVKKAKTYNIKFSLGSDAHSVDHLRFLKYATVIARRGWLEKKDVLNCLMPSKFIKKK